MEGKRFIRNTGELAEWQKAVLEAGELYLVGGAVRDMLMGVESCYDRDYLAGKIKFERLVSILSVYGKSDLVGKSFGVIKFKPSGGGTVDVSLPRTEHSTGWGHKEFSVVADPEVGVEQDLVRRDFTINSMAVDLRDSKLVDPLGGAEDIEKRLLRVNRRGSFREDPLRIIRGVQFYCRFKLSIEEETLELMEREAELAVTVSSERVREELNKMMLLSDKPGEGFVLMHRIGVLKYLIPELEETHGVEQNEFHPHDIFTHSVKSCDAAEPDLKIRWSALLHDIGKKKTKTEKEGRAVFYGHERESEIIARNILSRFRFSKRFIDDVCGLIRYHMFNLDAESTEGAIRRFISRVGKENLEDLYRLRIADAMSRDDVESVETLEGLKGAIERVLEKEAAFKITDLEISGDDIIEITGIEEGPEVGKILRGLFERVIEDPSLNRKKTLRQIVRNDFKGS